MRPNDAITLKFAARDRELELDMRVVGEIVGWIESVADHILETARLDFVGELTLVAARTGSIEFDFRLRVKIDHDSGAKAKSPSIAPNAGDVAPSEDTSDGPETASDPQADRRKDRLTIAAEVATIMAVLFAIGPGCRALDKPKEDAPNLPAPAEYVRDNSWHTAHHAIEALAYQAGADSLVISFRDGMAAVVLDTDDPYREVVPQVPRTRSYRVASEFDIVETSLRLRALGLFSQLSKTDDGIAYFTVELESSLDWKERFRAWRLVGRTLGDKASVFDPPTPEFGYEA